MQMATPPTTDRTGKAKNCHHRDHLPLGGYVYSPLPPSPSCSRVCEKPVAPTGVAEVLTARREKSRVAARYRRKNENQALISLRLALPMQPLLQQQRTAAVERKQSSASASVSSPDGQKAVCDMCAANTSVLLQAMPNYRKASMLSRQQKLSTPEFEKAVTIRLASSSLCLYDRLYCLGQDSVIPRQLQLTASSSGGVAICLQSRGLVAVLVDVTENTIVYAPPAYSQLLGVSWNATIGLRLEELRSRQQVASCTAGSSHSNNSSAPPFSASNQCDRRRRGQWSPYTVDDRCHHQAGVGQPAPDGRCEVWSHNGLARAQPVLSLLPPLSSNPGRAIASEGSHPPPPPSALCQHRVSELSAVDQLTQRVEQIYAACWSSIPLLARPPTAWGMYPKRPRHYLTSPTDSRLTPGSCSPVSGESHSSPPDRSTYSSSYSSSSLCCAQTGAGASDPALLLCLLQPIALRDFLMTASAEDAGSSFTEGARCDLAAASELPVASRSSSASFVESLPRSYHCPDGLEFVAMRKENNGGYFLSEEDLAAQHNHCLSSGLSLIDLVYPDELDNFVEDVASLSPGRPLITSILRLRTVGGGGVDTYRFCRLLLFSVTRDLLLEAQGALGNTEQLLLLLQQVLDGCNESASNPEGRQATDEIVVCCYQFAHWAPDIGTGLHLMGQSSEGSRYPLGLPSGPTSDARGVGEKIVESMGQSLMVEWGRRSIMTGQAEIATGRSTVLSSNQRQLTGKASDGGASHCLGPRDFPVSCGAQSADWTQPGWPASPPLSCSPWSDKYQPGPGADSLFYGGVLPQPAMTPPMMAVGAKYFSASLRLHCPINQRDLETPPLPPAVVIDHLTPFPLDEESLVACPPVDYYNQQQQQGHHGKVSSLGSSSVGTSTMSPFSEHSSSSPPSSSSGLPRQSELESPLLGRLLVPGTPETRYPPVCCYCNLCLSGYHCFGSDQLLPQAEVLLRMKFYDECDPHGLFGRSQSGLRSAIPAPPPAPPRQELLLPDAPTGLDSGFLQRLLHQR